MKRFSFPLESALGWRKRQMEFEQARLQTLEAERQALSGALVSLDRTWEEAQRSLLAVDRVDAAELAALDGFHKASGLQRQRLLRELDAKARAVAEQQGRLVEASRQYRLLEKLRQRRLDQWQSGVDKQLEDEAGELYLAKWRPES